MSIATATSAQEICLEPDANCQLPDQLGHGGGTVGATSDANVNAGFEVIDNFVAAGTAIDNICWWGFYLDFAAPADCGPGGVPDLFTVTYYANVSGFPAEPDLATVIGGPFTQGVDLTVAKSATGNVIPSGAGDLAEYAYTATHAAVTITPGTCYWISIQNDSTGADPDCFWLWSTAPTVDEEPVNGKGDGNSYQDGAPNPNNEFDLAFCLDSALTPNPGTVCDLPVNEGCIGATNPCDTPATTPGCSDPECCTLVCIDLAFCCINFWNQTCVDAAAEVCVFVPPAPEPCPPLEAGNCQLPDLSGSGGLPDFWFIGSTSDFAQNTRVADNFVAGETAEITQVCWWGFYSDGSAIPDCGAGAVDDFTVTYYADDGTGLPGAVLQSFTGLELTVTRIAETVHPGDQTTPDDDLIVYRYQGLHAAVGVVETQCYWLEIYNNLDGTCVWFWETAADNGAGNAFDYSVQDDFTAYDVTDGQDIDFGFCVDIVLGDVSTCAPPNPQELCDPAGAILLTQNADPLTIQQGNSVACVAANADGVQLYNTENYFARSYNLGVIPETQGQDVEVVCVRVAVESNDGSAYPVEVNVYEDTNGGAPTNPAVDLNLLGTTIAWIPPNTILGFVEARFDPPVSVPANTVLVVELFQRERDPFVTPCDVDGDCDGLICVGDPNPGDGTAEGFCDSTFDGGGMWPGTNNLGSTAQSYLRSPSCGVTNYLTVQAIGFPQSQLIQEVHVNLPSNCPWDCQSVPDGQVNIPDFLAILAQWGQVGAPCDFDGGGVSVTDFLEFLANFGPCP
jgi:hypothetical protein